MDEEQAVIEVDEDPTEEEQALEPVSEAQAEETEPQASQAEEEVVVSIGEEVSPTSDDEVAKAPDWVRELRKKNREDTRRIRELEEQLKAVRPAEKPPEVGPKPSLESCDYDAEKFEAEFDAWTERKRSFEQAQRKKQEAEQAQQTAWQQKVESYEAKKKALRVPDFTEAEDEVKARLSVVQQGVILQGSDNPELLVYALGKNPKKAAEIAAIDDPVKFTFAVAKLETQLKVSPRKPPQPESRVTGSAPSSGSVDKTLERLEEEALRTGDRTKIAQYRRSLKAKT